MACGLSPFSQTPGLGHSWVSLTPSLPPHLPPLSHSTFQKRVARAENFQLPSRCGYPWGYCTWPLAQRSPIFLAPGACFTEDNVSTDWGGGEGFRMIQAHFLCTLFLLLLHQLHLRSSGMRSWRLGIPAPGDRVCSWVQIWWDTEWIWDYQESRFQIQFLLPSYTPEE